MPYLELKGGTLVLLAALSVALAVPPSITAAFSVLRGELVWVEIAPGIRMPWSSSFYFFATLSFVAAAAPFAIVGFLNRRYVETIEKGLPQFFEGLEGSIRAGMPMIRALETAAKAVGGPLEREVRSVIARVELGDSLENALEWINRRIRAPALRRAANLVLVAYQSGGRVADVLSAAAEMYTMLMSYEEEKRASMAPYAYAVYVALAVFLTVATILIVAFIEPLERLAGGLGALQLFTPLPVAFFKMVFFIAATVQAFAGGLIASKITRGSAKAGFFQALVLVLLVALYFYALEVLIEPFLRLKI